MNRIQRAILVGAALLILGCGMYPAWIESLPRVQEARPVGRHLLVAPPERAYSAARSYSYTPDTKRLGIEWSMTVLVSAALVLAVSGKR